MLQDIKLQIITEEKRSTIVTDCNQLNGKQNITNIEYGNETQYALVTYGKYIFKIDNDLKIIEGYNDNDNMSNKINNFEPIIEEINGTYIKVKVPEEVINSAVKYSYLMNGEIKETITDRQYIFQNLDLDTEYKISIIATDEDNKIKMSRQIEKRTPNKLYLYKEGNECTLITGGWINTGYHVNNAGTFQKNENNMYIYAPSSCRIYIGTQKQIDLRNYKSIHLESEGTFKELDISNISYYNNNSEYDQHFYESGDGIDLSNYQSDYYVHCSVCNLLECTIKNIWLEK